MQTLDVFGFGQLRMEYCSKSVNAFPTRHVEELLGYLLVHRRAPHTREKLIDILWPRATTSQARARFSTVLWRLRTLLAQLDVPVDSLFQINRHTITFTPPNWFRFDLAEFENQLHIAATTTDLTQREQGLRQALNVYSGEPFEGLYNNWCLRERERLARLHLRTMGQLMVCLMQREAYEEAVSIGTDILLDDPLREEVQRATMYCYWKMGHHFQAIRQYEHCATLLKDELDVLPMAQTIALHQSITEDRLNIYRERANGSETMQFQLQDAITQYQIVSGRLNHLLDQLESTNSSEITS